MTLEEAQKLVNIIGTLAMSVAPGVTIAGFTFAEIAALAEGVAAGIPEIIAAVDSIKAAANGGAAPTPEQLLALKAAIDAGDDQIQRDAAAAKV